MDDEERPLLGKLRADIQPPPDLEARVRASLMSQGLLRRPRALAPIWGLAAGIAAIGLFMAGLTLGRALAPGGGEPGPRYALLLYDPAGFDRTIPESTLVEEYRGWAESLGQRLALGEKLGGQGRLLSNGGEATLDESAQTGPLGGLFIVRAGSWEEAVAIARSCPHLRHGGMIAVRRIEET